MDEGDNLQGLLFAGFGKSGGDTDATRQLDRCKRTVFDISRTREAGAVSILSANDGGKAEAGEDSNSEDDYSSDEGDDYPISHEMVLKTHERPVTSVTADPAGARLISASHDCTIKFHDFSSMTPNTLHSFKSIEPTAVPQAASSETHPVNHVEFNPNSPSQVLVLSATSQAKVYSRDGQEILECVKGDMYLRDLHNTKGHTATITSGTWHPTNKNTFVTASIDGTLRIWDVANPLKQKTVIVFKSKAAGSAGRSKMTAVSWKNSLSSGNTLVGAALDGTLSLWDERSNFSRSSAEIRNAHRYDTQTSGIDISSDGRTIVTRGGDDLIKLWDVRKFKSPISFIKHQSTSDQYPMSNIRFSPTSSSIITGSNDGHLHVLNPATLKPEVIAPITPGTPLITVEWHQNLNQVLAGSANGQIHVLFNPKRSSKGALMVMSRAPKRRHIDDDPTMTTDMSQGVSGDAVVGGSLRTDNNNRSGHSNPGVTVSGRGKDPMRPHIPYATPFARSQPNEAHIKNSIPLSSMRDEDPREALLKYADKEKNDRMFTNAWKDTQPKTIYAELSEDEDDGPDKKKQRK